MSIFSNPSYLLTQQYQNASNLDARIQLHLRFSTNPYGWQRNVGLHPRSRLPWRGDWADVSTRQRAFY